MESSRDIISDAKEIKKKSDIFLNMFYEEEEEEAKFKR